MKRAMAFAAVVVLMGAAAHRLTRAQQPQAPNPDLHYQIGPDTLAWPGVPGGEIKGPYALPSQAYPGTQHTYWVYVPAQYSSATAASLMIFQDGQAFMNPAGNL